MNIAVIFDEIGKDVDIIDIDESIAENIHEYLHEFFIWMFDENNKHRFWRKTEDGFSYCDYRADAFIEWLRDFGFDKNATLVKEDAGSTYNFPTIVF